MTKQNRVDPLDALGAVYETMYERVAENLTKARQKNHPRRYFVRPRMTP